MTTKHDRGLEGLKVGDEVFVVHQLSTRAKRSGEPEKRYVARVAKIGRKYGYIESQIHGDHLPFCISTGISHHGDYNARANGYGFDVWRCEAEYRRWQFALDEAIRLRKRIACRWGNGIRDLPHDCVTKIHEVLDEFEVAVLEDDA